MAPNTFPLPLEPDFATAIIASLAPYIIFISLSYLLLKPKFISWVYLVTLPGLLIPTVFYTDMALTHRLSISVLAPFLYLAVTKRTRATLFLTLALIFVPLLLIKPGFDLPLWFTNSLNDLRGQHTGTLLARLLHNKSDLWFYLMNNLSTHLSPVSVFAAHRFAYRLQIPLDMGVFPVGLLYPWDFLILLSMLRHKLRPHPAVLILVCLVALNLHPLLTQIYSQSLIFALALGISRFYARIPPPLIYLIATLLFLFTPFILLSYLPSSNLLL